MNEPGGADPARRSCVVVVPFVAAVTESQRFAKSAVTAFVTLFVVMFHAPAFSAAVLQTGSLHVMVAMLPCTEIAL